MTDEDVRELLAEARNEGQVPSPDPYVALNLMSRLADALEERVVAFAVPPVIVAGIIRAELRRDHGHRMMEACRTCERRTEKLVDVLERTGAFPIPSAPEPEAGHPFEVIAEFTVTVPATDDLVGHDPSCARKHDRSKRCTCDDLGVGGVSSDSSPAVPEKEGPTT